MMRLLPTTPDNLPAAYRRMLDAFDKAYKASLTRPAHYSVTTLFQPPYMARLLRDHAHELDGSSMVDDLYLLDGHSMHAALEAAEGPDQLVEERLHATLDVDGVPATITGRFDSFEEGILWDYKVTSVWAVIFRRFEEYEKKLTVYVWLMRTDLGIVPVGARNFLRLRDWSATEAMRKGAEYPQNGVAILALDRVPEPAETEALIADRVRAHRAAESLPIEDVEVCTQEERWQDEPTYAVKKPGVKTARRVLKSLQEAMDWIEAQGDKGGNLTVEERPGGPRRCPKCKARFWCRVWAEQNPLDDPSEW